MDPIKTAQSTKQHEALAFAIEPRARVWWNTDSTGVIAARIGREILQFRSHQQLEATTLTWWTNKHVNHSVFAAKINVVRESPKKTNRIQHLVTPGAGIEMSQLRDPDLNLKDKSSQDPREADASRRTSEIIPDRLSTIQENGDASPDWLQPGRLVLMAKQNKKVMEIYVESEITVCDKAPHRSEQRSGPRW